MERIIVEIYVAGTDDSYDFDVPAQSRVRELTMELIAILERNDQNAAYDHQCPILCDMDRGNRIDPDSILSDAGIRDGSRLMLL